MKKLIQEASRMQKLAGLLVENEGQEENIPEIRAVFANGDKDNSPKSRFAKSMSETLHLLDYFYGKTEVDGLTIDDLFSEEGMNDVKEGDDFYAGPAECLSIFKSMPQKFTIVFNMDGADERYLITKTGDDSFDAKEIK